MIWVSRLDGAGGLNCQLRVAVPACVAQKASVATLKGIPSVGPGGLVRAPEAKLISPGLEGKPLKSQGAGPLHTVFCKTESKA